MRCTVQPGHVLSTFEAEGSYNTVEFEIDEPCEYMTLAISLKNARMFPRNCGYNYSDCRMFLLKVNDDGTNDYKKGVTSCYQRECYMIYECLERGKWMLYTEVDW